MINFGFYSSRRKYRWRGRPLWVDPGFPVVGAHHPDDALLPVRLLQGRPGIRTCGDIPTGSSSFWRCQRTRQVTFFFKTLCPSHERKLFFQGVWSGKKWIWNEIQRINSAQNSLGIIKLIKNKPLITLITHITRSTASFLLFLLFFLYHLYFLYLPYRIFWALLFPFPYLATVRVLIFETPQKLDIHHGFISILM